MRVERAARDNLKGMMTMSLEQVQLLDAVLCKLIRQAFGGLICFGTARSSVGDQRFSRP
jgi:hypothetical protein